VVVSVHPMMTNLPTASCAKISAERNRHLPVFTVVTDLGSAHCLWFCNGVDKLFVASDQIRALAKERGKVPEDKIVQIGLPIRHDFGVQSEKLGDRFSAQGKAYQQSIRKNLNFDALTPEGEALLERKTILVMGGGEGIGSLSNIVNALYIEFVSKGIDANIFVVCGRNEALQRELKERDWDQMYTEYQIAKENLPRSLSELTFAYCGNNNNAATSATTTETTPTMSSVGNYLIGGHGGCIEGGVAHRIRKILSSSSLARENAITTIYNPSGRDGDDKQPEYQQQHSEKYIHEESSNDNSQVSDEKNMSPSNGNKNTLPLHRENGQLQQLQSTGSLIVSNDSMEAEHTPNTKTNDDVTSSSFQQEREEQGSGKVSVIGLGFVNNMAEYMVASDVLVTKAGPGTIAEAASLSLPVLLTSFLPGQEEGNVDFVENGKFGTFIQDTNPHGIAEKAAIWLRDEAKLQVLSEAAKENGAPNAARDIISHIGELAMRWKRVNETKDLVDKEEAALRGGRVNTKVNASGNTTRPNSPCAAAHV